MRITLALLASSMLLPSVAFGQYADYDRDLGAYACVYANSYEYPVSTFERRYNEAMLDWNKGGNIFVYGYLPPSTHPNIQWFMRFTNAGNNVGSAHIALFNDSGELVQEANLNVNPGETRGINSTSVQNIRTGAGSRGDDNFLSHVAEPGANELLWARVTESLRFGHLNVAVFLRILEGDGSGFLSRIRPMWFLNSSGRGSGWSSGRGGSRSSVALWHLNPASNHRAVGIVRLVNTHNQPRTVTLQPLDDSGERGGDMVCEVSACGALTLTAQQLELGTNACAGNFGDGAGKWRVDAPSIAGQGPMRLMHGVRNSALSLFSQFSFQP